MDPSTFKGGLGEKSVAPLLLVSYPNWVGDAVMALPALAAVRRSFTEGKLVVLARTRVAEVAEMSGLADAVIGYPFPGERPVLGGRLGPVGSMRRLGSRGALLLPNSFGAALTAVLAGIKLRGGYATDGRRALLTHPVPAPPGRRPRGHLVGYYLDLARALGFTAPVEEVPRLNLPLPERPPRPVAAFAPGVSFGPAKMWPPERFIELGRRLSARGCCVIILGSAAEKDVCRSVAGGIGEAAEDLSGKTTLRQAAERLSASSLAVCNDSGLMHLAAAVGVRLVALFGSTDPEATGPVSEGSLVIRGSAVCAPCFRRTCPRRMECFDEVTVDRVEDACVEILGEGGGLEG